LSKIYKEDTIYNWLAKIGNIGWWVLKSWREREREREKERTKSKRRKWIGVPRSPPGMCTSYHPPSTCQLLIPKLVIEFSIFFSYNLSFL
jgi:hypothetical protein